MLLKLNKEKALRVYNFLKEFPHHLSDIHQIYHPAIFHKVLFPIQVICTFPVPP